MQVWKYEFQPSHSTVSVKIPKGAKSLSVQTQGGTVCLWMLVDPDIERESREFACIGTGWDVPERAHYLGTAQQGPFVWHLFEVYSTEKELRAIAGAYLGFQV